MANLVMGAVGNLIPKLYELLKEEYGLQKGVKKCISNLTKELEGAQAALCEVAELPWDQLDKEVQLWACEVREASYDMEDVLDIFLVRVQGTDSAEQEESLLERLKKMTNLSKVRRKISGDVKDIMTHLQEVTERCRRYKVHDIMARPAKASPIDPRLHAMYNKVKNLVGINKSSGELISMLQSPQRDDDAPNTMVKIVSIVGVGGLGKTTLAKAVYDELKGNFDCGAFVPVGRNPDLKKIFKDILKDVDEQRYLQLSTAVLDERQLIDELRKLLHENKRYFVVIDDIWEIQSWKIIKLAFDDDNNCGSRIIITTRTEEVATKADEVYKLKPLSDDSSRDLLYTRISGPYERGFVHIQPDVVNEPDDITNKILRKCAGIPLAIITMASLFADKQREEWPRVYKSIGFGCKDNEEAENTMRILSFSYYDLPPHLRTCLLYLSAFPEDSFICKGSLIWKWVAEGFVHEEGKRSFEIGEGYFNDLINKSLIQAVENDWDGNIIDGCRVHDMVLDFIRSMSCEQNFFSLLDNEQGTLIRGNVRRLAHHHMTIGHTRLANNQLGMKKVRSFIALGCVIETLVPLCSLEFIRVLAIENCKPLDGSHVRVKHIKHLLHLRYLSLQDSWIDGIPEEIGALRFLQTLNLWESNILELPSSSNLPKQLACLDIQFGEDSGPEVFSVGRLTSLEELSIDVLNQKTMRWVAKELGSLRELRDLFARIRYDEETETDLVESLRHLHKLQRLSIDGDLCSGDEHTWQESELVLPPHLQHLDLYNIKFCKLPSCIKPSCLPNLSHLNFVLENLDDQDLKILGRLPQLRYLCLEMRRWTSFATISNISDSYDCYFPKLRCCRLPGSMVWFVANKEDKSFSFYMWDAGEGINMTSDSEDGLQQSPAASVSDDELKSGDGLQSPMPSVLVLDDELHRPFQRRKLHHGPLNQVGQHPLISSFGSTPSPNAEDPKIAMPSVSDDEKKKGSICSSSAAAAPRFMPSLEVLYFQVSGAIRDHIYCQNLGLEYLPSLREITANLYWCDFGGTNEYVRADLRRASQAHPNRPTLRFERHL